MERAEGVSLSVCPKSRVQTLRAPHPEAQGFIVTYAGKRERRERVREGGREAVRRIVVRLGGRKGALISGNIAKDGE